MSVPSLIRIYVADHISALLVLSYGYDGFRMTSRPSRGIRLAVEAGCIVVGNFTILRQNTSIVRALMLKNHTGYIQIKSEDDSILIVFYLVKNLIARENNLGEVDCVTQPSVSDPKQSHEGSQVKNCIWTSGKEVVSLLFLNLYS
ncbi:hypothetical protein EYF80_010618 [Liparis tanakae]|uniref:Uncharacterized protein n=1 Tax=Liparis tanakae TaxID=230148 RepID=A0A4Z2IM97_9TELE|nr:hypothetical protein EYF80_010618 [Liparis tanakae]